MQAKYSVVIPVYNGVKTLEELALSISKVFHKLGESYEIIFVDDDSSDSSWQLLIKLAQRDKAVKAIKLAGNWGQHNATLCGMSYAQGEFTVTIDDDLQHDPADIPKLIAKMQETGADVIIAKLTSKTHSWYRRQASDLMKALNEILMKKPSHIYLSSYRLLKGKVVNNILRQNLVFPYMPALIFGVTSKVANVVLVHRSRKYGESNYNLYKMATLASRLLLNRVPGIKGIVGSKPVFIVETAINIQSIRTRTGGKLWEKKF